MRSLEHLHLCPKLYQQKRIRRWKRVKNQGIPCNEREIKMPSVTCVHCEENSELLPENIRGGHYLHNRHVCAVLQCEHAPYGEVQKI